MIAEIIERCKQRLFDEAEARGRAEGEARGRAEEREALLPIFRGMVLNMLKARFASVQPRWTRAIEGITDTDMLNKLGSAILELDSPEAFDRLLSDSGGGVNQNG